MKVLINKRSILMTLFYIIMLCSYFQFDSLNYVYTSLLPIYKLFNYASFIIIFILLIKDRRMSKIIALIMIYLAILFISSLLNGLPLNGMIYYVLNVLGLCLITDYGIRNDTKEYLNALSIILNALILLNVLTIIMHPDGMYINATLYRQNWLLGYKNSHILFMIPCLIVNFIQSYKYKNKIDMKFYLIFVICFISIILAESSASIVGLIIILIYVLIPKFIDSKKIFNSISYFIVYLVSFFSILFFKIQKLFSYLIVDVLKEDLTFTGRTYIWDDVLLKLSNKPFLGNGNITYRFTEYIYTTHNTILDILYKSGWIGLIVYLIILLYASKILYKYKTEKISNFLSIALLGYFVIMLVEAYNINYYLFILVICSNVGILIGGKNNG